VPAPQITAKASRTKIRMQTNLADTITLGSLISIPSRQLSVAEYRDWINDIEEQVNTIPGSVNRNVDTGESIGLSVTHTVTPGLYVRELTMPAGLIVVSRIHLREHPFYILSGEVSVYDGNGVSTYVGPYKGITKPGTKRVLYTHKDTVWVTFHATDKTTVEDLEKAGELVCDKFDEFDVIVNSEVS
jgi:hypothetical protein